MFTRCPECQALYRLTPEQLRIARGKVRCGRCSTVFDALEALVEQSEGEHADAATHRAKTRDGTDPNNTQEHEATDGDEDRPLPGLFSDTSRLDEELLESSGILESPDFAEGADRESDPDVGRTEADTADERQLAAESAAGEADTAPIPNSLDIGADELAPASAHDDVEQHRPGPTSEAAARTAGQDPWEGLFFDDDHGIPDSRGPSRSPATADDDQTVGPDADEPGEQHRAGEPLETEKPAHPGDMPEEIRPAAESDAATHAEDLPESSLYEAVAVGQSDRRLTESDRANEDETRAARQRIGVETAVAAPSAPAGGEIPETETENLDDTSRSRRFLHRLWGIRAGVFHKGAQAEDHGSVEPVDAGEDTSASADGPDDAPKDPGWAADRNTADSVSDRLSTDADNEEDNAEGEAKPDHTTGAVSDDEENAPHGHAPGIAAEAETAADLDENVATGPAEFPSDKEEVLEAELDLDEEPADATGALADEEDGAPYGHTREVLDADVADGNDDDANPHAGDTGDDEWPPDEEDEFAGVLEGLDTLDWDDEPDRQDSDESKAAKRETDGENEPAFDSTVAGADEQKTEEESLLEDILNENRHKSAPQEFVAEASGAHWQLLDESELADVDEQAWDNLAAKLGLGPGDEADGDETAAVGGAQSRSTTEHAETEAGEAAAEDPDTPANEDATDQLYKSFVASTAPIAVDAESALAVPPRPAPAPDPGATGETLPAPAADTQFPGAPGPRGRKVLLAIATGVLALLLAAQWIHMHRDELVQDPGFGPTLRSTYEALGHPLPPNWDLNAYDLRQESAIVSPGSNVIRIRVSLRNRAARAQPYPIIRLVLVDVWGEPIGQRDLLPAEYLASEPPAQLGPGEKVSGEIAVVDPQDTEARNFEIDACLWLNPGGLQCASAQ
jgi:predicted Zn finger-like uncharacterized protein